MKDLTQGSELKTIFYFSLPILVGNLFQQLYNVADSVIVGNFLGKESLAAVGFSYQINFLLIALSTGISLGASVLTSRYFGARDMWQVKKVVDTGFLFSAVLSLVIAAAGACFSYQILVLFRVPENLLTIADTYLKIIFIGVIPTFAYNSLTNILRGVGDSKTPGYFLHYRPEMGCGRGCGCDRDRAGFFIHYLYALHAAALPRPVYPTLGFTA